ncbi:hypothetical protein GIB67_004434 [Kingdonia uniflora]|uniref:Cytochrome P450 n=1 Tax=Kingdonia uniflora TaxID=39325 RepID=A0A7J7MRI5_9MAGN|nr:hypothetical protein GIB67_004434 [Kingdonia uniflora]
MAVLVLVAITLVFLSFVFKLFRRNRKVEYLPRGSLGFPLIGESLSFVKAQKENRGEEWINERISKHGPVFKTSLMGFPTVVITGQADGKSPKEAMFHDFDQIFKAVWFVPLNFPANSIISVISEQMEIFLRKRRSGEEKLTCTDLQSMKYTWRVAQEFMKIIPLVFGNFREAAKDLYFGAILSQRDGRCFGSPMAPK